MNKDEVALELYRLGVLDRIEQMVSGAEWDWGDAVIYVLADELRRQRVPKSPQSTNAVDPVGDDQHEPTPRVK